MDRPLDMSKGMNVVREGQCDYAMQCKSGEDVEMLDETLEFDGRAFRSSPLLPGSVSL